MCQRKGDSLIGIFLFFAGLTAAGHGSFQEFGPYVTAIWVGFVIMWLGWLVL